MSCRGGAVNRNMVVSVNGTDLASASVITMYIITYRT